MIVICNYEFFSPWTRIEKTACILLSFQLAVLFWLVPQNLQSLLYLFWTLDHLKSWTFLNNQNYFLCVSFWTNILNKRTCDDGQTKILWKQNIKPSILIKIPNCCWWSQLYVLLYHQLKSMKKLLFENYVHEVDTVTIPIPILKGKSRYSILIFRVHDTSIPILSKVSEVSVSWNTTGGGVKKIPACNHYHENAAGCKQD